MPCRVIRQLRLDFFGCTVTLDSENLILAHMLYKLSHCIDSLFVEFRINHIKKLSAFLFKFTFNKSVVLDIRLKNYAAQKLRKFFGNADIIKRISVIKT